MTTKRTLRRELRAVRRAHVDALDAGIRALILMRPPAVVVEMIPQGATIGLYSATADEAPAGGYARWFSENGYQLALPRLDARDGAMEFALHGDPFGETDLEDGPFGLRQPTGAAPTVKPDALFVPLVAFTDIGERLGQGGGHYDRWLAAHPDTIAIGLGWDCQLVEQLPMEDHDRRLHAVVTPTRLYGPFA